ncbi:MAG: methyl-accepting chemotaxis protein [bacterium]
MSRRITLALALELLLVMAVAVIGARSLASTTQTYEAAMTARRELVAPASRVETELSGSDVGQLRYLLDGNPVYLKSRDSLIATSRQLIASLQTHSPTPELKARWGEANRLLGVLGPSLTAASNAKAAGRMDEVMKIRLERTQPQQDSLNVVTRLAYSEAQQIGDSLAQAGLAQSEQARGTVLVGALFALFVGVIGAVILSRSINRPLRETANVIATSSAEILAATTEQAAGTNESMAAVTETVATVDQVAQTAAQSAQRARTVADSAQRASESGRAGRKAVQDSISAMQLVQDQVEAMAKSIVSLAQQAQSIGEITSAVSDIAEQTKLLALNAAVESTRAGEHGRGFALVAAEIKSLAGEAKESTVQVRRLLADVQKATSAAVMATEQGTKQTDAAMKQVRQAGDIIAQLAVVVDESAQAAAQIGASAGQQALGMDQIRQAISNIHDATQQSLAATHQSELAAQGLNEVGVRLVELVGARA